MVFMPHTAPCDSALLGECSRAWLESHTPRSDLGHGSPMRGHCKPHAWMLAVGGLGGPTPVS